MNGISGWQHDLSLLLDRLGLGLNMFGPYADWFWVVPAFWAVALPVLWLYTDWQQSQSDRAFLAYASRQLPLLRHVARQRAQEVALSKRIDR